MENNNKSSSGLEWRVKIVGGSSEILAPETGLFRRVGSGLLGFVSGLVGKVRKFCENAWNLGVDDPRKFIHCFKVGLALTLVSLFYYMRPLYDGVGGNAMWAIMTVVVVFEYTVGSTLYKCINRIVGTSVAGVLAIGVHWVADKSGEKFEPIILGASVCLLAIVVTFWRFIPKVKARFDYGLMIFILTFSLVSVSSYRVDKLIELAHTRLSTIAIGTALCLMVSMLISPVWAGKDLHQLIIRNMDKLADSLDGTVVEYLADDNTNKINQNEKDRSKKLLGYKCVLNSKATEESLANFARWEPAHGNFSFRHPWKQYLKIGIMMRSCAYCIEALNGCINSSSHENDNHEFIKKNFNSICMKLSSQSSRVLKELGIVIKTMTRSSNIDFSVGEMNSAVEDLHNTLKSLPTQIINPPLTLIEAQEDDHETETRDFSASTIIIPLMEVLPVVTLSSLLIEIATRIEKLVDEVEELSNLADFKPASEEKIKQNNQTAANNPNNLDDQEQETMKALQMV